MTTITTKQTSIACPELHEVFANGVELGYIRMRHDILSIVMTNGCEIVDELSEISPIVWELTDNETRASTRLSIKDNLPQIVSIMAKSSGIIDELDITSEFMEDDWDEADQGILEHILAERAKKKEK